MRRFEVEAVQVRQVTWDVDHVWPWRLRRTSDPLDPRVEIERGGEVVLRIGMRELLMLREAIDVLAPNARLEEEDEDLPWEPYTPRAEPRARVQKPAKTGQPWTPEDEAILTEGHAAGASAKELADRLERTRSGVEARLVKLGLVAPKPDGWRALHGPAPAPGDGVDVPLDPAGDEDARPELASA